MQPANNRNALDSDLDFCTYCPGEPAIGWRDVSEEDGTRLRRPTSSVFSDIMRCCANSRRKRMTAPESTAVCQHCGKAHSEPRGFDLSQMLSRGDAEVKVDTVYLKCLFDRLNKMHEDNTRLRRKLNRASYDLDMECEFGGL